MKITIDWKKWRGPSTFVLANLVCSSPASAQIAYSNPSPQFVSDISTPPGTSAAPQADCPSVAPKDGNPGDAGQSYDPVNATAAGTAQKPTGTGIYVSTTGQPGQPGGYGSTCYSGYGGGNGGAGGAITITNQGKFVANGSGIIAISQGGAGGVGGDTKWDSTKANGGNGGIGGDGGSVSITNSADIYAGAEGTTGHLGMYGSSIGGNGGLGGSSESGLAGAPGNGNPGGQGGSVSLTNKSGATITTLNGYAMMGISVGGYGGGSGNSIGFIPAPSASGANGGLGGVVTLVNDGSLLTFGVGQAAMVGVSVGGGGGDAGRTSSLAGLGAGNGSAGVAGGTLNMTNSGSIETMDFESVGMAAVSVGGGGGSGGMASGAGTSIGGSGGDGGNGGEVVVANSGTICTGGGCSPGPVEILAAKKKGGLAPAIAAVSVGGGGGMGGYGQSGALLVSTSIGGAGGDGGSGGAVYVTSNNTLKTTEVTSSGVLALSVGGGGGHGGGAQAYQGSPWTGASVAIGGSGGGGGDGGIVGVNCGLSSSSSSSAACSAAPNAASSAVAGAEIKTLGHFSPGILAGSVGGGGGGGGFAVALSADFAFSTSVSIGGSGGSGGAGGAVYANTAGVNTITRGVFSSGIEALSVGGGGGNGGTTFYWPDYTPGGSVAIAQTTVSVGGNGGDGGAGGDVMAENSGANITTYGHRASGIFAGSIGGSGGHGGAAAGAGVGAIALTTTIGGQGGVGDTGGNVTVNNTAVSSTAPAIIKTYGRDSHAIEALSVGGGGGSGGWSADAAVSLGGTSSSYGVGGTGGGGANGGAVTVTNTGVLEVYGLGGSGITAMSVAGGGGNGGLSAAADISMTGSFAATVGGKGGGGGTGGTVTVTNDGVIATGLGDAEIKHPARSTQGIVAMSIGGSGGRGGMTFGGSLVVQSVPGTPAFALTDAVGGSGAAAGAGGDVTVTNNGTISSLGDLSNGITAMSIGGRGGLGGIAMGGSIEGPGTGSVATAEIDVAMGGGGGNGGAGGDVSVTNNGTIETAGFRAIGATALSLGGHGGMGGISMGLSVAPLLGVTSTVSLGGQGGDGGVAGAVTITQNAQGSIKTGGAFSAGLLAQSIGGSGGIGGIGLAAGTSLFSPDMVLGGDGGGGASGGAVTITASGNVETRGPLSAGILGQSIGGNGGMAGVTFAGPSTANPAFLNMTHGNTSGSGANAQVVLVQAYGPVATYGDLSPAIVAESIAGGGGRSGASFNFTVANVSNADSSVIAAVLGSTGGNGGVADSAMAKVNYTPIVTHGAHSDAVYAGSIGGGGGSADFAAANITLGSKTVSLSAGSSNGAGGDGGQASASWVDNPDDPEASRKEQTITSGAFSHGYFAQSIGGGGGSARALHSQLSAGGGFGATLELGGSGSGGGSGGPAWVGTGDTTTKGLASNIALAQSIGGGGGQALAGLLVSVPSQFQVPGTPIQFTVGSGSAQSPNGSSGTSTTTPSTSLSQLPFLGSASSMSLGGFFSSTTNSENVTVFSSGKTTGAMADVAKAQSIGGGGGFSAAADINSGSPFAASTMSLGGGGSGGASPGTSFVQTSSTTEGPLSLGALSQSIGGGGGDARHVSIAPEGLPSAFVANLGAKAEAAGGSGGKSSVIGVYGLRTSGTGSDGLVAQSIGGGGGFSAFYGGAASAPAFATSAPGSTGSAQAGIVSNYQAATSGESSSFAGYANNASNAGGSVSTVMGASTAGILGAAGGENNGGGEVELQFLGDVTTGFRSPELKETNGDGALGLIAQSIGAGGGIFRQHLENFDQSQTSLSVMLGAMGSASGNGGTIKTWADGTKITTNKITTYGLASVGVLSQSIGGGGGLAMLTETTKGSGGSASLAAVLGGKDSTSGTSFGSKIEMNLQKLSVTTYGDQAQGLVAQSISNGGGMVKAAINAANPGQGWTTEIGKVSSSAASLNASAGTSTGLAFGAVLGSSISAGSSAGQVEMILVGGSVSTAGARSTGILAQSVSGGGGVFDITANELNGGNFTGSVNLGGTVLAGAGAVSLSASGSSAITTTGDLADGVLAQSITGGGGSFGVKHNVSSGQGAGSLDLQLGSSNGGSGGNLSSNSVEVNYPFSITTSGFGSSGITAQSIAAGGGLAAFWTSTNTTNLTVNETLGSTAGFTSTGSTVTVTAGPISTTGDYAPDIVAQSIGSGGGRVVGNQVASTTLTLGSSGDGGSGGKVTVSTLAGSLSTSGANSHGVVAQSIGGGGGLIDHPATNVAFGSTGGGAGGNGGTVNVTTSSSVTIYGSGIGVLAQAIGGGGGFATASSGTVTFGGIANGGWANGGAVNVTTYGAITTNGDASPGVVAMSVGGGGGAVVGAPASITTIKGIGDSGNVTVSVNSSIATYGSGSDGVVALSLAGGGGVTISDSGTRVYGSTGTGSSGAVSVSGQANIITYGTNSTAVYQLSSNGAADPYAEIAKGVLIIGGKKGRGVFQSGAINNLNNAGYIGTFDGINGMAIETAGGATTVNNTGTTFGSVRLGGTSSVFNNLAGGVMQMGPSIDLGANGSLTNAGLMVPGGGDWRSTTTLRGDLTQLPGGKILVAMRPDNADAAKLNVVGNVTATGRMGYTFDPTATVVQGNFYRSGVITATGTMNTSGLTIDQTALVRHSLVRNGNSLDINSTINFSPAGMSTNGSRFGQALAFVQARGSSPLMQTVVGSLITVPQVGTVDRIYSGLAGDAVSSLVQTGLQTAQGGATSFAEQADRWRVMGNRPADKPWRSWVAPYGGFGNLAANSGEMSADFVGGTAGVDVQVSKDTIIGVGGLYGQNQIRVATASLFANQYVGGGGVYGMTRFGQAYLSGSTYVGSDSAYLTRSFGGFGTATSPFSATTFSGRVEVGYAIPFDGFRVTPYVAFSPASRWQNGVTEQVAFAGLYEPGVTYHAQSTRSLPLLGGAQLDTDLKLPGGSVIATFLRAGFAHEFNTSRALVKSLSYYPDGQFLTGGNYAVPNAAVIRAGAQHKLSDNISLFAYVNSILSDRYQTLGGNAGLMVHW